MEVTVNGQVRQVPDGASVEALIEQMGLADRACAAEVNGRVVPRSERTSTPLHDGDRVELVTLVGGG